MSELFVTVGNRDLFSPKTSPWGTYYLRQRKRATKASWGFADLVFEKLFFLSQISKGNYISIMGL